MEQKKKSNIRLYHKTDQHWNQYGALMAYMKIIEELRKDFPKLEPVEIADFEIDSAVIEGKSLAKTISVEDEVNEMDITVKPVVSKSKRIKTSIKYKVPEKFPYKTQFYMKYKSANDTLPKVLLVRDSYSNALLSLLPESFSETLYIWDNWCYRLNEPIVEDEAPDIYITIVIESNLEYILYGHPSER